MGEFARLLSGKIKAHVWCTRTTTWPRINGRRTLGVKRFEIQQGGCGGVPIGRSAATRSQGTNCHTNKWRTGRVIRPPSGAWRKSICALQCISLEFLIELFFQLLEVKKKRFQGTTHSHIHTGSWGFPEPNPHTYHYLRDNQTVNSRQFSYIREGPLVFSPCLRQLRQLIY